MQKVISTERVPIKLWLDDIEDSALTQAKNLANLPFVCKHVVALPDAHYGFGMMIGGVIATQGYIIPNAIGKDISCGVIARKTSLLKENTTIDELKKVMAIIRETIPAGLNGKHREPFPEEYMPAIRSAIMDLPIVSREFNNACKSLKSLGSGNHFLELQIDTDGYIWVMIHSGSRNLGSKVADHYNDKAKKINAKYFSLVDPKQDLAFLPIDTVDAQLYWKEMTYCMAFAQKNRDMMMDGVCEAISSIYPPTTYHDPVNISHNYAAYEHHFGENFIIHRKGATSARAGELGIIPGSQGTKSFIVKGKGNPESFMSCSHGSGRVMSRAKAKKELDLANEIKILDDQGIIHGIRNNKDLEEAVSAYKDINIVMDNQKDLVDIVTELHPIAVVKG